MQKYEYKFVEVPARRKTRRTQRAFPHLKSLHR